MQTTCFAVCRSKGSSSGTAAQISGEFSNALVSSLGNTRTFTFSIDMPSLRDRRDDIPQLVRCFLDRYARSSGKRIKNVSKESLTLLQSYAWPGNVRELQNVIERSVIVSDGDTLTVDERWFHSSPRSGPDAAPALSDQLTSQERATIEAALTETRGKVSGPTGAAAKLRMPASMLESRIRALGISKNRFKTVYLARDGDPPFARSRENSRVSHGLS
jgi:DNA-binding NtrC family response regulator